MLDVMVIHRWQQTKIRYYAISARHRTGSLMTESSTLPAYLIFSDTCVVSCPCAPLERSRLRE